MPQWYICCLISPSKKGGKIQTGLNCEYDGLSEVILSLSHSSGIDACLKKQANWAERLFMLGPNVSTSSRFAASVCIVHFSLYVVLCITEIHRAVSQIRNLRK